MIRIRIAQAAAVTALVLGAVALPGMATASAAPASATASAVPSGNLTWG